MKKNYWKTHKKIDLTLSQDHVQFIATLLSEDDKSKETSDWRENNKKDLRFLLHITK